MEHLHRHWDTLMAEGYTRASFEEQTGRSPDTPGLSATSIVVQWDEREVREVDVTSSLPKAKLKPLLDSLPALAEGLAAKLNAVFDQLGETLEDILDAARGTSTHHDELREIPDLPGMPIFGGGPVGEANRGHRRYHLLRV